MSHDGLTTLYLDEEGMGALENVVNAADAVAEAMEDQGNLDDELHEDIDIICEVADFDRGAIRKRRHDEGWR